MGVLEVECGVGLRSVVHLLLYHYWKETPTTGGRGRGGERAMKKRGGGMGKHMYRLGGIDMNE